MLQELAAISPLSSRKIGSNPAKAFNPDYDTQSINLIIGGDRLISPQYGVLTQIREVSGCKMWAGEQQKQELDCWADEQQITYSPLGMAGARA